MIVSCIAALSDNYVIGKDNQLPWHLPADLAFFKQQTLHHTVIAGRKSFESAGVLPKRRTIVLTRDLGYAVPAGVFKARSLDEALALCQGEAKVFILGGEKVFEEAIASGVANQLVLTRVHAEVEGDTCFPRFDPSQWRKTWESYQPADERNVYAMTFEIWER